MTKIVINKCYGGFSLSEKAAAYLGCDTYPEIERDDPRLVECVEKFGLEANGDFAELAVVEIPDNVTWCIEEYDGSEWVAEQHRTWS
jgi:hypothetical protein